MPDLSSPGGTWYLRFTARVVDPLPDVSNQFKVNRGWAHFGDLGKPSQIEDDRAPGRVDGIDDRSWDPATRRFRFRRRIPPARRDDLADLWEWYDCTIVDGTLVGRYGTSRGPDPPPLTALTNHVTGWNYGYFETHQELNQSFRLALNFGGTYQNEGARLRLDRDASGKLLGRLRVYSHYLGGVAGPSVPGLEYDLDVQSWNGLQFRFTRSYAPGRWSEEWSGTVQGNTVEGEFWRTTTSGGKGGEPPRAQRRRHTFKGTRGQVLGYGLAGRSFAERQEWQERTRKQIIHLIMDSADGLPPEAFKAQPPPLTRTNIKPAPSLGGLKRDDDPEPRPRDFEMAEIDFEWYVPHSYNPGRPWILRRGHGFLATPTKTLRPPPYPAVISLNGHGGSGWSVLNPGNTGDVHEWHGDAFARRGCIVLGLDISHREDDQHPIWSSGDVRQGDEGRSTDPTAKNHAGSSIKSPPLDTDWEPDGERVGDVMRALDFLLRRLDVDRTAVYIVGHSMGAEVATIAAALDPRIRLVMANGYPADTDAFDGHWCRMWEYSDMQEYLDVSDYFALMAPRPAIFMTGKQDHIGIVSTPSVPSYATAKQIARRARVAYRDFPDRFVHYLHYDIHTFQAGGKFFVEGGQPDAEMMNAKSDKRGLRVPVVIAPPPGSLSTDWQLDGSTRIAFADLFECIANLRLFQRSAPADPGVVSPFAPKIPEPAPVEPFHEIAVPLPQPTVDIAVRVGTRDDLVIGRGREVGSSAAPSAVAIPSRG